MNKYHNRNRIFSPIMTIHDILTLHILSSFFSPSFFPFSPSLSFSLFFFPFSSFLSFFSSSSLSLPFSPFLSLSLPFLLYLPSLPLRFLCFLS